MGATWWTGLLLLLGGYPTRHTPTPKTSPQPCGKYDRAWAKLVESTQPCEGTPSPQAAGLAIMFGLVWLGQTWDSSWLR